MPTSPELLSPAGSLRAMRMAFAYGADAVYAGQPRFSLRVRNNEFDLPTLAIGIAEAHAQGKKFYVVCNIAPHNSKLQNFVAHIEPVVKLNPDALIVSDPGVIFLLREHFPNMPLHLSVQANTVNWAAVKFWHQQGIERVILSRELGLEEIREIRQRVPEMEIEVFVHGALCMAYSGRCLLSGYMNHRDANQGSCTNACRWKYDAHEAEETYSGDYVPKGVQEFNPNSFTPEPTLGAGAPSEKVFLLQELNRPNEYMPTFEDQHGTYIMNSKDLRAIQHVEELIKIGVHSLKIEGRTKSHYYAARTTQAYRKAIDDAIADRPFDMGLMDTLENMSNRGYTEGFFRRHVHDEYQNYERGHSISTKQQFVAEVQQDLGDSLLLDVKNRFEVGDNLELMTPNGNINFNLNTLVDKHDKPRQDAPGSGFIVKIPKPEACFTTDFSKALLIRNLPNQVIAHD